jgi:hypothetical protein
LSSISNSNYIQTQQTANGQLTSQSANIVNQQQATNSKIQSSSQQPSYIKRTVRSEKMTDDSNGEEQPLDSQDSPNPYYNKLMNVRKSIKNDKINLIKESGSIETTTVGEEIINDELINDETTPKNPHIRKFVKLNKDNANSSTKTNIITEMITNSTTETNFNSNNSSRLDFINDDSPLDWSSLIDNDSEKTIYESFYELLDNDFDKKGRNERLFKNRNKLNKS